MSLVSGHKENTHAAGTRKNIGQDIPTNPRNPHVPTRHINSQNKAYLSSFRVMTATGNGPKMATKKSKSVIITPYKAVKLKDSTMKSNNWQSKITGGVHG